MRVLLFLTLAACAPTIPADDDDDDPTPTAPSLSCDDPQDPPPTVASCGLHEGIDETWNWSSFEQGGGGSSVLMVRKWEAQGAGHSAIYSLQGFAVQMDGCLVCVSDLSRLDYESSHHNWIDVAWGELDGVTLRFETRFQPLDDDPLGAWDWRYLLSGHDPADTTPTLWGPIELGPLSGLQPPA